MKPRVMKNEVVYIDRVLADPIAERYFNAICGFSRDLDKFKSRQQDGLAVRDRISDRINVRAVVSAFGKEVVDGKSVCLDGVTFECNAFGNIDMQNIHAVIAFIITAGNVELQDSSMLDMFYSDTWGTAYVDAGRDILKIRLLESFQLTDSSTEKFFISDCFGPGFYGMEVSTIRDFFKVLDCWKIGVKLTEGGMMLPVKSVAGFYVVVDDQAQLPDADCRSCINNKKGCRFCKAKTRERS